MFTKNNCKKILTILALFVLLLGVSGCGDKKLKTKDGKELKITKSETAQIEYEDYDNGNLKMQIPKGWKVIVPTKVTYSGYSFKVYNPENKDYTFAFSLGLSGFLKSEAARKKWASLYPSSVYGQLPAINPQTTEQFYKVWNTIAKVGNKMINQDFFETLKNFEVIENLGKTELGGDVLRGKFENANGEAMQGLFTATIFDPGSYRMYGLDLAPLNSYHNIMMYAPDAEFNNWQSIYDHCLATIEFTDDFMTGFRKEQQSQVATVQANAKIYDEISNMIMDSWNKRNNSYDIISQKRSDATLGYERVYNTDTGEVYRTYNGFTDEYNGTEYQVVTDDMYTKPISGYIEK
jgi:hypothetical protein